MEKSNLVSLIQIYAKGRVNNDFNPQALAEAILKQMDFNKPIDVFSANKNRDSVKKVSKGISDLKKNMEEELKKLGKDEKLFANFLRGKITAYKEIKGLLK